MMSRTLALRSVLALFAGSAVGSSSAAAVAVVAPQPAPDPTFNPNSSITVPVMFLARPAVTEAVTFSGQATITSRIDLATEQRNPTVEFLLELNGVVIVAVGAKTGTRFALKAQDTVVMPYMNNQQIEIVFALPEAPEMPLKRVRTGLAKFAINVDLASGAISSASATLTTRLVPN